jgi:hypothetical protein
MVGGVALLLVWGGLKRGGQIGRFGSPVLGGDGQFLIGCRTERVHAMGDHGRRRRGENDPRGSRVGTSWGRAIAIVQMERESGAAGQTEAFGAPHCRRRALSLLKGESGGNGRSNLPGCETGGWRVWWRVWWQGGPLSESASPGTHRHGGDRPAAGLGLAGRFRGD